MEGDELQSRFLVSVVDPTNVWALVSEVWSALHLVLMILWRYDSIIHLSMSILMIAGRRF